MTVVWRYRTIRRAIFHSYQSCVCRSSLRRRPRRYWVRGRQSIDHDSRDLSHRFHGETNCKLFWNRVSPELGIRLRKRRSVPFVALAGSSDWTQAVLGVSKQRRSPIAVVPSNGIEVDLARTSLIAPKYAKSVPATSEADAVVH